MSRSAAGPILLAWSGGKDSSLALHALGAESRWRVAGLLTTVTEGYDRVSIHGVRTCLLEAQAAAIGLPLTIVPIPPAGSNSVYEERMRQALLQAREQGVRDVAFGDIFLDDVRAYREEMVGSLGMAAHFPLWGKPTDALALSFLELGFGAILTCVDTTQIDPGFAGRAFDLALLRDLPRAADPCGENGEFHTFVHRGPILRAPIEFEVGERVLRDARFMYCDLLPRTGS
jgi:uncharacterized protein (TIGR00290 family)